jgi:benzoyl-CoA reductase subunit C
MNNNGSEILSKIETYYQDYGQRARELTREGKKVIGYICSFVPVELITAAGCVPFRIRGDIGEPITKGDTLLETIVCPFIRSCFDLAVKGRYDFLSGIVIPHGCDSMTRSYSVWSYSLDLPYSHFINIPSVVKESSYPFFYEVLGTYKKSLEEFVGREIKSDEIKHAISLHNRYRDKIRAIYDYRKSDPPMISGVELTKILTIGTSIPVDEANALLDEVLETLSQRKDPPLKQGPRIMIDGACLDNIELVKILEESGANVVADTLCNGTRDSFPLVDESDDPINALAHRYLDKINCPKTYRDNPSDSFEKDIHSRFGDIGKFAREFNIDGAVLYVYIYCDPFGFEVPARKAYYDSIHIPLLYLETQYSTGTIGQLKTRIEAFLEMID